MIRRPPRSTLFPTRRSSDLIGTDVRVIGVSPDTDGANPITLTTATLNWLDARDRKSTRLNSSHVEISYAVFCLKKKKKTHQITKKNLKSTHRANKSIPISNI